MATNVHMADGGGTKKKSPYEIAMEKQKAIKDAQAREAAIKANQKATAARKAEQDRLAALARNTGGSNKTASGINQTPPPTEQHRSPGTFSIPSAKKYDASGINQTPPPTEQHRSPGTYKLPSSQVDYTKDLPSGMGESLLPNNSGGGSSGGSGSTGGGNADYTRSEAQREALRTAEDLAKLYGNIDFDNTKLEGIFQNAVRQEYKGKADAQQAYLNQMDQGFSDLAVQRELAAQRALSNRVQTGASQGMSAITEMLAARDAEQQFADQRLEALAEGKNIAQQEKAALAGAIVDAEAEATMRKQSLATLGSNIYSADTESYLGELGYDAQMGTAKIGADAERYATDGQVLSQDILGRHQANAAAVTGKYNLASQDLYKNATIESANIRAGADQSIANLNWDSNKLNTAASVIMEMNKGSYNFTNPADLNNFLGSMGDLLGIDYTPIPIPKKDEKPVKQGVPKKDEKPVKQGASQQGTQEQQDFAAGYGKTWSR